MNTINLEQCPYCGGMHPANTSQDCPLNPAKEKTITPAEACPNDLVEYYGFTGQIMRGVFSRWAKVPGYPPLLMMRGRTTTEVVVQKHRFIRFVRVV